VIIGRRAAAARQDLAPYPRRMSPHVLILGGTAEARRLAAALAARPGILEEVRERGTVAFAYDVVPGVSSVSALVARHRTGLNRVARPVQITTGRRLAEEGFPEGVDDVVVMLDAHQRFRAFADEDVDIYWGAYIGTPDEILVSGPVAEAAPRIERLRAEARERKGWIMDTYLLRRAPGER
jgi:precorrin-6A synthase